MCSSSVQEHAIKGPGWQDVHGTFQYFAIISLLRCFTRVSLPLEM